MNFLGFRIKGLHFSLYFWLRKPGNWCKSCGLLVMGSWLMAQGSRGCFITTTFIAFHFFGKMKYSFISSLFGVYPNTIFLPKVGALLLQILAFIDMHHKHIFYFCINRDVNRYIIKIKILILWFKHSKELFWNIILLLIQWVYMSLFKIKRRI